MHATDERALVSVVDLVNQEETEKSAACNTITRFFSELLTPTNDYCLFFDKLRTWICNTCVHGRYILAYGRTRCFTIFVTTHGPTVKPFHFIEPPGDAYVSFVTTSR